MSCHSELEVQKWRKDSSVGYFFCHYEASCVIQTAKIPLNAVATLLYKGVAAHQGVLAEREVIEGRETLKRGKWPTGRSELCVHGTHPHQDRENTRLFRRTGDATTLGVMPLGIKGRMKRLRLKKMLVRRRFHCGLETVPLLLPFAQEICTRSQLAELSVCALACMGTRSRASGHRPVKPLPTIMEAQPQPTGCMPVQNLSVIHYDHGRKFLMPRGPWIEGETPQIGKIHLDIYVVGNNSTSH